MDAIEQKKIDLIINTPAGKQSKQDDSYIRKAAIKHRVCYMTTLAAADASAKGIAAEKGHKDTVVKSLQEYHNDIR